MLMSYVVVFHVVVLVVNVLCDNVLVSISLVVTLVLSCQSVSQSVSSARLPPFFLSFVFSSTCASYLIGAIYLNFKARCRNNAGWSDWANMITKDGKGAASIKLDDAEKPSCPLFIECLRATSSCLYLQWQAPLYHGGQEIVAYILSCTVMEKRVRQLVSHSVCDLVRLRYRQTHNTLFSEVDGQSVSQSYKCQSVCQSIS
jgi:hypothetical protein